MRKAADALAKSGYEVMVLWAYGTAWAAQNDRSICENAHWQSLQIGGNPDSDRRAYFFSRLFRKLFELIGNNERAQCRSYNEFIRQGLAWKPDLVIGHNPGALGPVVRIGQRLQVPILFDAEDYHRGESYVVRAGIEDRMIALEDRYIPHLSAMTAASPLIAQAYTELYPNKKITTINNAFPAALQPIAPERMTGPLRIVWFSQVVGIDRGLQDFMKGMASASDIPVHLNLVGLCSNENREVLEACIEHPNHQLSFHDPMPEPALFEFLGQHEIGLALEFPTPKNRDICRTNKLYTYPLAGCFMLASKTTSQVHFIEEYPATGEIIELTDFVGVARVIQKAHSQREKLLRKRLLSYDQGRTTLNWEVESRVLIMVVQKMLNA